MSSFPKRPRRDRELVQIVDAAFADAAQRSGKWLACRVGCTQCCIGVFPINELDAARLREGMKLLQAEDPQRAATVRQRAIQTIERLQPDFPGDIATGILSDDPVAEEAFAEFANDEPCPALDPETGACDVYSHRPMTCRVFGPPLRTEEGLGHCELCFQGASVEEVARCEMIRDPEDLETSLIEELHKKAPQGGDTLVCFVLAEETGIKSKTRSRRSGH